jgi:hypothetical protein
MDATWMKPFKGDDAAGEPKGGGLETPGTDESEDED